jgi:hypothetical protein
MNANGRESARLFVFIRVHSRFVQCPVLIAQPSSTSLPQVAQNPFTFSGKIFEFAAQNSQTCRQNSALQVLQWARAVVGGSLSAWSLKRRAISN